MFLLVFLHQSVCFLFLIVDQTPVLPTRAKSKEKRGEGRKAYALIFSFLVFAKCGSFGSIVALALKRLPQIDEPFLQRKGQKEQCIGHKEQRYSFVL